MITRASAVLPKTSVLALDVDGVLLDPERAGKGRWQQALGERYGVDATLLDEVFFRRSWSEVIVGHAPIEMALDRALVELGWEIDVEAVLACWFDSDFEIVRQVVDAVRGWAADGTRVVLATNQEMRRASYLRRRLDAVIPIEGIAYSGALGVLKNDPDFYAAAEDYLGMRGGRERVVLLDDTRENVDAAERHGWVGVHYDRHGDWGGLTRAALGRRDG